MYIIQTLIIKVFGREREKKKIYSKLQKNRTATNLPSIGSSFEVWKIFSARKKKNIYKLILTDLL